MADDYFKKIFSLGILFVLGILAFFMLKPLLLAIILGILLAFIVNPIYKWLDNKINMPSLSISIMVVILLFLILLPIWFLTPIMIDQTLKLYSTTKTIDFVEPLKKIFPPLFASEEFSGEVGSIIYSFVNKSVNSFSAYLVDIILNFPALLIQLFVVLFTFFFALRDQEKMTAYVKSLLPFSKEVEKKLFEQTKGITVSVLYGQILIGIIQGFIAGIGFFIFGVKNALLLTLLAVVAGALPIVGTTVIWVPVAIYLVVIGSTFSAIGVSIFGLIANFIDSILKPMFVSNRTSIPPAIVLFGMVGGYFVFGILGFVLGPLVLAYLIIILEIYRNKKIPGILIKEETPRLKISI